MRAFSVNGVSLRDIELPGKHPSDCFFDPSGELGLIVIETGEGELLSVSV